jgi:hypothetical protein
MPELPEFLFYLAEGVLRPLPVEAHPRGPRLETVGPKEGGHALGHAFEDGLPEFSFLLLPLLPLAHHFLRRLECLVPEDMGVAGDHLRCDGLNHVCGGEVPALGGKLCVEDYLEEQVPQLFLYSRRVVRLDGLDELVGLLDEVGLEGLVGLLLIPGAALPELVHDAEEFLEFLSSYDRGVTAFHAS